MSFRSFSNKLLFQEPLDQYEACLLFQSMLTQQEVKPD